LAVEKYEQKIAKSIVTTADDYGVYKGLTKVADLKGDVDKAITKGTQLASKFTNVTKTLT